MPQRQVHDDQQAARPSASRTARATFRRRDVKCRVNQRRSPTTRRNTSAFLRRRARSARKSQVKRLTGCSIRSRDQSQPLNQNAAKTDDRRSADLMFLLYKNILFIAALIVSAYAIHAVFRYYQNHRRRLGLNEIGNSRWLWAAVAILAAWVLYKICNAEAENKSFIIYLFIFILINVIAQWTYHTHFKRKYGFVNERRFSYRWTRIVQIACLVVILLFALYNITRAHYCSSTNSSSWAICAHAQSASSLNP